MPNIIVPLVSSPAVSGDTSTGSSPAVQIHWQSNMKGAFRVESAGLGIKGSGQYLTGGDVEADTGMVTTIPGSDLEVGDNRIYIYVTNEIGVTGYTSVDIVRDDLPPVPLVNVDPGLYGSAKDVTIYVDDEPYGMRYIYYTTDGSNPTMSPDETTTNSEGINICHVTPFRPRENYRCRIENSDSTNPIHIEPYLESGCTASVDCEPIIQLKFFAEDVAGNVSGIQTMDYDIDMRKPEVTIIPGILSVKREGTLIFSFTSGEDGQFQVVLNPGSGNAEQWDSGKILKYGVVKANAEYNVEVSGAVFEGTAIIVVRAKDIAGQVGQASITVTRDDLPPEASANPGGGTYGWVQFNNTGTYNEGVTLTGFDSDGIPIIYYTINGDTPSLSSDFINSGGFVNLLTEDEKSDGISLTKKVILNFIVVDTAGNQSPIYQQNYSILPSGGSLNITIPANEISIPKDGFAYIKIVNTLKETMEYVISLQWGQYLNPDYPLETPEFFECHPDPYGAGEDVADGVIAFEESESTYIGEGSFPIEPYNAATYPTATLLAGGENDTLILQNEADRDLFDDNNGELGFQTGAIITYDYGAGGAYTNQVRRVVEAIGDTNIRITPPLSAPSEIGKTVKIWGSQVKRKVCVYSRVQGDTGAWAFTSREVKSDFSEPRVQPFTISRQYLARGGNETTTISFMINGSGGSDITVDAIYTIRTITSAGNADEKATDILTSGTITAENTKVNAHVFVDDLQPGANPFRIYVSDPYGNVGKSANYGILDRNDTPSIFALSSVSCGTSNCTVGFTQPPESGFVSCNQNLNEPCNATSVPLNRNQTYNGSFSGLPSISINTTDVASFTVSVGGTISDKFYSCWYDERAQDNFYCSTGAQWENRTWSGTWTHPGQTISSSVTSFNWNTATWTGYTYTGSKIFTYTNEYGLKSSLLVDCSYGTGCLANPF